MIFAGAATGVLYMLVHVVLGRMMGKVEYAQVVALLGLLNVLSVFSKAMGFTVARFVAEHIKQNAVEIWVTIFKRAVKRVSFCILGGFMLWIACSGLLKEFFKAPSYLSIVWVGLIASITMYRPIIGGTLHGSHKFGWQAGVGASTALFRLLFGSLAIFLGWGINGVLFGVALSVLAGLLLGSIPVHSVIRKTTAIDGYDTKPIYRYLWPVLLGQSAFFLLMFGDVMMSARFLSGEDLAVYGKASTLSRTVLFLASPVAIAMFPRAVNSSRKMLFYAPLTFALVVALGAAMFITIVPEIPMRLMYGEIGPAYLMTAVLYAWAALPLSLSSIATQYLWARHKPKSTLLLVPVVGIYALLLFLFHDTPRQMIACLGFAGWSSILVLFAAVIYTSKRDATECE